MEPLIAGDVFLSERTFGPVRPSPFDTPSRVSAQLLPRFRKACPILHTGAEPYGTEPVDIQTKWYVLTISVILTVVAFAVIFVAYA